MNTISLNSRHYSLSTSLDQEIQFDVKKNYLFDLNHLGVIQVNHDKASEFLQGQLTCDLREINEKTMRQGAQCNLKGRVLALLDVIYWQGYQLVLPRDLISPTLTSLAKVALLSRITLQANTSYKVYGFLLNNEEDLLPFENFLPSEPYIVTIQNFYCYYTLDQHLYIILAKQEMPVESFSSRQQLRGGLGWHYLQVSRQQIQIYPSTRGLFLPHRLNLPNKGYINFKKGCYKGQEIIARMEYLGKLKYRLQNFLMQKNTLQYDKSESLTSSLKAGTKLMDLTTSLEWGELIDFCPISFQESLITTSTLPTYPGQIGMEGSAESINLQASE